MTRRYSVLAILLAVATAPGCGLVDPRPETEVCLPEGYVFYIDGAGGGGLVNWSSGVRQGLQEAGYNGFGEMFSWETGLGPVADQIASVEYKRIKARDLMRLIETHRQACATDPVHIITHSAGSAIGIYTLEQMPDGQYIDNMAMLGPSISADHDLTRALRHVRGRLYVYTSGADTVLSGLVPLVGTADDVPGGRAAGLSGFNLPPGASDETRRLYAEKVQPMPWRPEFEGSGNYGGHLDVVNAAFVRNYVARRVMGGPPPGKQSSP